MDRRYGFIHSESILNADLQELAGYKYYLDDLKRSVQSKIDMIDARLKTQLDVGELASSDEYGVAYRYNETQQKVFSISAAEKLVNLGLGKHFVKVSDTKLKQLVKDKLLSESDYYSILDESEVKPIPRLTMVVMEEVV